MKKNTENKNFDMKQIFKTKKQLPISEYQKRFFLEWVLAPDETTYNVSLVNRIVGNFNEKIFKKACEIFIKRNEVVHAQYSEDGKYCYYGDFSIDDFYSESTLNSTQPIELQIRELLDNSFDLSNDVLLRLHILRNTNTESEFYFVLSTHHIICDAIWGLQFNKQIESVYNLLVEGSVISLDVDKTLTQTIENECSIINADYKAKAQKYWLDFIGDAPLHLNLPYRSNIDIVNFDNILADKTGEFVFFELTCLQTAQLKAYAKDKGTTVFLVLSALFGLVLSKYCNQKKILLSYPVNMRSKGFYEVTGCFVNNVPLKFEFDKIDNLDNLIKLLNEQRKEVKQYQGYSLTDIIQDQRKYNHSKINHFLNVEFTQTNLNAASFNLKGLDVKPLDVSWSDKINNEIGLLYDEYSTNVIKFKFEYRKALFEKSLIDHLITSFKNILVDVINGRELFFNGYSILTNEEFNKITYQWNSTDKDYPSDKVIYQLFQEQVEKTPDKIAFVYEDQQLTYQYLNAKSNQLARNIRVQYLQRTSKELAPNAFIALYLERSLEMVIGILAVLKAGGAYIPMDTSYPQERIDYIVEDTQAELVLSKRHQKQGINSQLTKDRILLIDLSEELYQNENTSNLVRYSTPSDLAYLIYTSGTTGKPKGVMIHHKGMLNHIYAKIYDLGLTENDTIAQTAPATFDISVWQFLSLIVLGGKVVIVKKDDILSPNTFLGIIENVRVSIIELVPSITSSLLDVWCETSTNSLKPLRWILLTGESLSDKLVQKWFSAFPNIPIVNAYGPTEASDDVTHHVIKEKPLARLPIPIGKPIINTRIYIVDEYLSLCPIGVRGEICVTGFGVGMGYLNELEKTQKVFLDNPFDNSSKLMYKTGDIGYYQNDGSIVCLGRVDNQVKIRGNRIELGEIESRLLQHDKIRETLVITKNDIHDNKYLCCYYVAVEELNYFDVKEYLEKCLPGYMVPEHLIQIASFPLTANGKIDRNALPEPDFGFLLEEEYFAPTTELETRLCEIYAEVLGLNGNQISIHQNFFSMGGNSILSINLKHKLNKLVEFEHVSVADLYKYNSIDSLIQSIQQDNKTEYILQNSISMNSHEVAIIGISGAFSGIDNVAELWQIIESQKEGIRVYSYDECKQLGIDRVLLDNPNFVPSVGRVRDIELFDPLFWNISPNEAKLLDPQIRKFIEHCWYVLESSGYANQRKKSNIGVFAGSGNSSYLYENILNGEIAEQINLWEASISNNKDALATKTAYLLGLTGPAHSINTACSTGLVSVVEACQKLKLGLCNMALAGGVSLSMPDKIGYIYQEGMIASKDGHCKTFDKEASGTTGGSGVGVVLLKRLEDAIRDKDRIIAIIKGYATNNDGDRKTGFTAPSVVGQSECIINAQIMAGITPDQIDYIECHGTATNIGDPIEIQALKEAFEFNESKEKKSKHKTVLGSIKANIGHADSAAGTVGLIKVCLMLQNNVIPGQVNFNSPNPELYLDQSNFEITKENRIWLTNSNKQRIAGVSSFGIGGTNAHMIVGDYVVDSEGCNEIEEIEPSLIDKKENGLNFVIPISAKNRKSLEFYKQAILIFLTQTNDNALNIKDIAYTLQERRESYNFRSAYCASNIVELISVLKQDTSFAQVDIPNNNKIVFMFPGQGTQYNNMAIELYNNEQVFKNIIDQIIVLANQHLDVDLCQVMYQMGNTSQYDINETQWAQISLFVIEYALAKYLEHLGVKADAYIGHSIGEYVAATLSGVFTLEQAIKVVIVRGKLMQSMRSGSMLAINDKEENVKSIVQEYSCEISVINSPEDIVVSGNDKDIIILKEVLDKQGISSIILNTSHAYHSVMMEQAANEFESVFKSIKLNKPNKVFVSNLTGEIANEEVTKANYWCKHLRNTVQFDKGINNLLTLYNQHLSFIEVGAGKALCFFVNKYKTSNVNKTIQTLNLLPSAKEAKSSINPTSQKIENSENIKAKLWIYGIVEKANDTKLFEQAKLQASLPVYQFNYQKCWLEKNKDVSCDYQLKLLPKERWISVPVWSAVNNLTNSKKNENPIFKNALVFIRDQQVNLFDFNILAQNVHIIVLDTKETGVDTIDFSVPIRLNPKKGCHFEQLAGYLKTNKISIDAIIHICSINNEELLTEALCYSFYSLFLIRQYLLYNSSLENLIVLTNGLAQITNADMINPANGTLVGAIRNINHELLGIDSRLVDIGCEPQDVFNSLLQLLKDESFNKSEELLALRFGKLWMQSLKSVDSPMHEVRIITDGDVILITGGLGGIALSLAEYVSVKHRVVFILVCRSNIYDDKNQTEYIKQKIKIIEGIRSCGSTVEIFNFDISDDEKMHALVHEIKEKYGNITGIIHTAGVAPLRFGNSKLEDVEHAFKGKVFGINTILNVVNLNCLKFVASTSSLASIMGDINRIEYCASNSYLDYMSVDRLRFKNTKFISVNWPGWSDIGMIKEQLFRSEENPESLQGLENVMHLNSVGQNEGAELFYRFINQTKYDQVIVSKLEINKLRNELFKNDKIRTTSRLVTIVDKDYTETEYKMAQILGEYLGVDQISLHDDFFSLGVNSILAIKVAHRISKDLGCDINVSDLFMHKTINNLKESILFNSDEGNNTIKWEEWRV